MRVPRLHAITDDARLADARFADDAAAVLEEGGAELALHLRGRGTSAARLHELAVALLPIARASGAKLLVNDRVDVALVAKAHGAQLREDSMEAMHARELLGPDALIGVSRHVDSIGRAQDGPADFVIVGHVFATRSHSSGAPLGIAGLRRVAAGAGRPRPASGTPVPLIAIGGITPERAVEVVEAGAYGVAALSGIWEPGTLGVRAYLDAISPGPTRSGAGRQEP